MKVKNEALVGILVVVVLSALVILTFRTGEIRIANKGYELKARFINIDGVERNSPVRLNGLEIGYVKDIKILYEGAETIMDLTLWMEENAKVRNGAKAYVKNMGLLGEKYIGLTAGETGAEFLSPGAVIHGIEPGSFEKILSDGEVIASNLKEISIAVNERLKINSQALDEIVGNLRLASQNIASLTQNVDERLTINKGHIDEIAANLHSATNNLEELSYDLKVNPWKLLYKPKREKASKPLKQ